MEIQELVKSAFDRDLSDIGALTDAFELVRALEEVDFLAARKYNLRIRRLSARYAREHGSIDMFELNKKSLLFDAPHNLDAYLQYLEWARKPEERFYLPRRRIMRRVAASLQKLVDNELDELFLSFPPRTGKTTMLMMFATWLLGREPERSNLYSAYSDIITSAFYTGCLEIINDPVTYLWHDVFPTARIVSTNAKDETLNIDRKKRYPSLTCRSLYGTLNGACDCNGLLMADDLIGGIEEALNQDRMISAWTKVDNNLIPRAKESAKILWCGTRWSMIDPAGLRMDLLLNDERFNDRRYEIINLPALDEHDESNFNYLFGVGFSTDYYHQRRASFERNNDMASWMAQYMGEPIERAGALFEPKYMQFYNGVLPDEEPVRIFMAVDPAFGGGDFTSAPICYQYEDGSIYVHDIVFNDGDKRITQPLLVKKILEHQVQAAQFELNRSTASYKEDIEKELKERGYRLNITTRMPPNNIAKEYRIRDKAPEIRELYFREEGKRHKEYSQFMQNLYSFKIVGKNKNDDAADSMTQVVDMIYPSVGVINVVKRIF